MNNGTTTTHIAVYTTFQANRKPIVLKRNENEKCKELGFILGIIWLNSINVTSTQTISQIPSSKPETTKMKTK